MRHWLSLLSLLGRAGLVPVTGLGLCLLLRTALTVAIPFAAGNFIGALTRSRPGEPAADTVLAAALVALVLGLTGGLGPLEQALAGLVRDRVDGALREELMARALGPPTLAHLEDPAVQELVRRVWGAAQLFSPGAAAVGLLLVLGREARVVALGLVLAGFRWWLGLLLVGLHFGLVYLALNTVFNPAVLLGGLGRRLGRADYFYRLAAGPGAAKEVRLFGLGGWLRDRYRLLALEAFSELWAARRRTFAVGLGAGLLAPVLAAAGLWEVGRAGLAGELDPAGVVVVAQAVLSLLTVSLGNEDAQLMYGRGAAEGLDRLRRALGGVGIPAGRRAGGPPRRGIRFEGVRFRYPGGERDVLCGLDLEIPAGRAVAIVGPNGAGKTTVVKLLARLYDPTAGRITVDGVDLRELDPGRWQRQVAVLFQNFIRYPLTAAENIVMGAPDRASDRAAFERALGRAGVWDLLAGLPGGPETPLGAELSGGVELSAGQWQRIGLARALFAAEAGASVLVLDEPTASLDVRAEAEFFDRFFELTRGLTTVVISHRFAAVRRADRIYVLSGGRVVEAGSHAELLQRGGLYADLYRLQARIYR